MSEQLTAKQINKCVAALSSLLATMPFFHDKLQSSEWTEGADETEVYLVQLPGGTQLALDMLTVKEMPKYELIFGQCFSGNYQR